MIIAIGYKGSTMSLNTKRLGKTFLSSSGLSAIVFVKNWFTPGSAINAKIIARLFNAAYAPQVS